ncbi:uncharacterized protein B0P05DRAFT_557903 [Gilbertella persicaria]|uniref:uncharacterized protein n=1 Tax=Gilbertella persicaria TaxID=101096 RepID=UPI0022208B76|nr:uncharacterized protein B0P05DRAFT_557903 [Gilbertella persicaria]KAI8060381.1 hypothetical protein B0P05DRAFT_557903 [Gilbertella persicaria]
MNNCSSPAGSGSRILSLWEDGTVEPCPTPEKFAGCLDEQLFVSSREWEVVTLLL